MKKMFVVSLVLAAALAVGCSKKQPQTMPTGTGDQTEMKKDGSDTGGATYGEAGDAAADPCAGGEAADPCAAPQ